YEILRCLVGSDMWIRDSYDSIIDPSRMSYHETYNASEGFFAVRDSADTKAMLLLTDCGVFFEFTPADNPDARPVPCWEISPGNVYALTITSANGLWRYPLGDTVRIESVQPLRVTVAGRTKSFINAFGEELMVHNADAALTRTCRELGCAVVDYTAAPVYTSCRTKGHHQWAVEFSRPPRSMDEFAATLDRHLCDENSDYAAKREGGIFLAPLELVAVPDGTFNRWLASTGKLGGQRKIPRLSNDRRVIDALLSLY
ncbi:MAG: GH3 auxin-responsive promoter family protein, partial [Muribaculaceae bacterium]|nr:GH3 auxin-responsive promoter family protein [Muribaculaceae bacterium]